MTWTSRRAGVFGRPVLATLLAVLALVASACGGGAGDEQPTTLRVLMTDDWVTPTFLDTVRDFERENTNVRIAVDKAPIREMPDTVRAGLSTGSGPDVVQYHAFSAASEGLAEPLDDLWAERLEPAEFFPGALEDVTWAGKRYGVPLDTNALVLILNTEALRVAGVERPDRPMSFADFGALARALTSSDGSRRGIALPTSTWWTMGWVVANGGELVTVGADGRPTFGIDSAPVVQAIGFLSDLVRQGVAFPPRAADSHSSDAFALFQSGTTAVHASGSWDLTKLRTGPQGAIYKAAPMPRGVTGTTNGSAMGGSSLFVPKGSPNRELAFRFMVHLVSDRYAIRFAREEGRLPVRERLFADPFFQDAELKVFLEQLRTARPETLNAFPDAAKAFARAIDQAIRVGRDAAEALGEAQRVAEASVPR
ncbi:MAG TPA: extracellular solute-binding protein [Acidimicrobiales bacterium]|nr:extracellular solute-binding protein [Acidimicrobiales bacterium]